MAGTVPEGGSGRHIAGDGGRAQPVHQNARAQKHRKAGKKKRRQRLVGAGPACATYEFSLYGILTARLYNLR
jgi:hypothetical protein